MGKPWVDLEHTTITQYTLWGNLIFLLYTEVL